MQPIPYVGVTGLVSVKEVCDTIEAFVDAGYAMDTPHVPMIGFLASLKTLSGKPTENKRYPKIELLPELVGAVRHGALPMIHYNSREQDTLAEQVGQIFQNGMYDSGLCRALQLNVAWPKKRQVGKIKEKFPEMQIVLQVSAGAMQDRTAKGVAECVDEYGRMIDYVLIDPSGGKGQEFDVGRSVKVYRALNDLDDREFTIGFAGGLKAENVYERVGAVSDWLDTKNFCIDAEGGLRDKLSPEYGDDLLNQEKVRDYLQGAAKILP